MTQQHNPIDRPTEPTRSDAPTDGPADDGTPTVPAHVTHYHTADPELRFGPPAVPGELGRLAHYRIRRLLGKGGMGAVYLGFDEGLQRKVALKVMLPRAAPEPAAKDRFQREARAAARVKHDNVVTIYQVGEDNGTPYIAMEYLSGYSLDEYLRQKRSLSLPQALRVGREAAAGLAAAHALGLVHRDIKPANLWLEAPNGRVKILDFGLAKATGGDRATDLTTSGDVVGTPQFMAPEQARGEPIDHRADLFSLGAVLYRLTTGRLPFTGPTVMAVLTALALDDPPPVLSLNPAVPPALADLIHMLLAKRPDDRPQTADEVLAALKAIRRGAGDPPEGDGPAPQVVYATIPVAAVESNAFVGLADDSPPAMAAPPTRRATPAGLWAGVGAAVVATIGLGYYGFTLIPSPPPPEPTRTQPQPPRPVTPKPPRLEEPARTAARWVLKMGGKVRVDTADSLVVTDPGFLPTRPFRLVSAELPDEGVPAKDEDLENLRHLDELDVLDLGPATITNRGLETLASFPFAGRLTTLALPCAELTDAGLMHLPKFRGLVDLVLTDFTRPTPTELARVGQLTELSVLELQGATLPAGGLAPLRGTKLTALTLSGCTIPDDGLNGLQAVQGLEALKIEESKINADVLRPLAGHPNLRTLELIHGTFPDDALAGVRGLPALRDLSLLKASVGNKGVAHLAGLTGLKSLKLEKTRITAESLPVIAGLTGLESLDLGHTPVTNDGLRQLARLTRLTGLGLRHTAVTDAGLDHLAAFGRLQGLDLIGTQITDAGLMKLAKLTGLKFVHVVGTKVTADGVAKLKAALPNCQVYEDVGAPK